MPRQRVEVDVGLEKLIAAAKEDFEEWADDCDESDVSDDDKTVREDGGSKENDASMTKGGEDDADSMDIVVDGQRRESILATCPAAKKLCRRCRWCLPFITSTRRWFSRTLCDDFVRSRRINRSPV
jgi:hypothetical protein